MISAEVRRTVRTLYGFSCGYCGVTESEVGSYLTMDHFQPLYLGGSDDINNLIYACHACNLYKSSAGNLLAPPVLHPHKIEMNLHIIAQPDGILKGLTPEGLQHIEILHLNRPPLIQRRKLRQLIDGILELEAKLLDREKQIDKKIDQKKRTIRKMGHRYRR